MPENIATVVVSLHYWAAAKAAAGVAAEDIEASSVAEALESARIARRDPRFDRVIAASSVLIDGIAAKLGDKERQLTAPVRVEVLPPFAGG